jgi:glycosyltransferase involved in cell wall biosynthesis
MPKISILLPAYNEAENLERAVDSCADIFSRQNIAFEVIVVNDGSSDATAEIANTLQRTRPYLRVFHHEANRGMGAAMRTGAAHTRGEFILTACADLQFDMREAGHFISAIEHADIVAGYKEENTSYSIYRHMNTFANLLLLRVLFGLRLRNPNWVKLFRKEVFKEIPIEYDGFFWDSALLIRAQRAGFRFAEVPTTFHPRVAGVAMGSNPLRVAKTVWELVQFWIKTLF